MMLSARPKPPTSQLWASSPLLWAAKNATIIHPIKGRIPFKPYPFQVDFLQDRSPRRLVVKARQIGFSQVIALEALHEAIYTPDTTILLVSRSGDLAAELLTYCYNAATEIDDMPALTRQNQDEMGLANGSRIKSLPANRATGRGFAGRSVYLDEYAFQQYAEEIYRSISPVVGHGGRLTVGSSPDGRGNHFFHLFSGQDGGEWSRHTYPWRACPAYDDEWYARERPKYTAQMFASEYECDFAISGQAVFNPDDIAACPIGWLGLQPPSPSRRYLSAWDIGRRQDATVGITFEVLGEECQIVAFERLLGVPYPVIQAKIEARSRAYRGETWVESNGVGDPVIENLTVAVEPFTTTAKTKAQAITALALLHEKRLLKHDIAQLRLECSLYQWNDTDLIQDCVMAAAIGAYAMQEGGRTQAW